MDDSSLAESTESYRTAENEIVSNEKRFSNAQMTDLIFDWARETYGDLGDGADDIRKLCAKLGLVDESPKPQRHSMPALGSSKIDSEEAVTKSVAGPSDVAISRRRGKGRPITIISPNTVSIDASWCANFSRPFSMASSNTLVSPVPPSPQSSQAGLSAKAAGKRPLRDIPYYSDGSSSLVTEPSSNNGSSSLSTQPSDLTHGSSSLITMPSTSTRGSSAIIPRTSSSLAMSVSSSSNMRRYSQRSIRSYTSDHAAELSQQHVDATLSEARKNMGCMDELTLREAQQVIQVHKEEFLQKNASRQIGDSNGRFCRKSFVPRLRLRKHSSAGSQFQNSSYNEQAESSRRAKWEQSLDAEDMVAMEMRAPGELIREHRLEQRQVQRKEFVVREQIKDAWDSLHTAMMHTRRVKGLYREAMDKLQFEAKLRSKDG